MIDVIPVQPRASEPLLLDAEATGATENTVALDSTAAMARRWMEALAAADELKTGGYVTVAPALRGSVDVPANVTAQSGRLELRTPPVSLCWTAFLRGNLLNEVRDNGTPLQTNATRLWRYVGGADGDVHAAHAMLRLFGSRESYRQSFSAIAPNRDSETLTREQRVPADELGFAAQASRALGHAITAALGADMRDVRATDNESPVMASTVQPPVSTSARQRDLGGYVDAIWQPTAWSVSGSVRVDSFRTFDVVRRSASARPAALPELDEIMVSPRMGLVRHLPHNAAVTATVFRAFRGPTMNELYRTGQVGQQTTLANDALLAERATGFELGLELSAIRLRDLPLGRLRATYFWTEVNRPISTVSLAQTATTQLLQRQNLGQIRSRGVMIEAQTTSWRGLDASVGYQFAVATVTAFNAGSAAQANLTGKWIPEVPRESVTATLNYRAARVASFHLIASYEGQEFDDSANTFLLHPYARFDLSAERSIGRGLSLFAGAQNLLNRAIDAGRTPVLTLAAPRLVEGGLRYNFPGRGLRTHP